MQPAPDDLIVSTPERVDFAYQTAGIGSRFLAQLLDVLAISLLLAGAGFAGYLVAAVAGPRLGLLVAVLLVFVIIVGYFWLAEAISGGRTLGKAALHMRVVGTRGEPVDFGQVSIRNLVRIVDFLPVFYGAGLITLFANGRGQRLGDLAAGTTVILERGAVRLADLVAPPERGQAPGPGQALPPLDLDPDLKRFLVAYQGRRERLSLDQRAALAEQSRQALARILPEVVASQGPLAALEWLAGSVG